MSVQPRAAPKLRFSEEELLASHPGLSPQVEAGHRLHGGFDASGRYVPPRLLHRGPALDAWTEALRARGGELLPADSSLLAGVRYPSEAQAKLLLREGLGQTFWNSLTITGRIEARGRVLADLELPDFGEGVLEDVSGTALGHLNRGLLRAHGLDEGGERERGIGGHDTMWFALRDLAFGPVDFPEPEVPANIARPESDMAVDEDVPERFSRTIYFLLNLLMIEFRAERGFSFTEAVLRDPELFAGRRTEAERAARIVGRIRADEEVHVRSLRLILGEIRSLTFRTRGGGTKPGAAVVDRLWDGIVRWATVEQPRLAAEQQRAVLRERILRHPEGERVLAAFDALEEREARGPQ
jgi:hypothetical protein